MVNKYFLEVKNRILLILFAWLFCFNVCYYYKKTILFILINSNKKNFEFSSNHFIFTNITDIFYVYFDLILFLTNQVTILIIIYQIVLFFARGFYKFEFQRLIFIFLTFVILEIFAFIIVLLVVIPLSWNFFLSFQTNSYPINFFFEAKLNEFLKYCTATYYVCLVNCGFLLFAVIILVNLSEKKLKKTKIFRKLFYLLFLTFSTLITPEIFSQLFLNSLFILIYECILIVKKLKFKMATN